MPNYRVLVTFDPERSIFVARAPELDSCSAEGATRAEALTKVEAELESQAHNMRGAGGVQPAAFDDDISAWTGDLATKVSRTLHRDLAWQAKAEGVELQQLLSELLAVGLDARRQRRRPPIAASAAPVAAPAGEHANEPNGNSFNERPQSNAPRPAFRGGQRDARDGRYHAIMDDRATFVEYVRGLEGGGGGGGRGPMSGGGRNNNNYQGGQPRGGRGSGGGRGPGGGGRGPGQGGGGQGGGTPPAGGETP